jgi:hypothetical protein
LVGDQSIESTPCTSLVGCSNVSSVNEGCPKTGVGRSERETADSESAGSGSAGAAGSGAVGSGSLLVGTVPETRRTRAGALKRRRRTARMRDCEAGQ